MADAEYVAFVEAGWERYPQLAYLLTGDRHHAEELLQDARGRANVAPASRIGARRPG